MKQVNWADQMCDVLEETASQIKVRFTNATGTGEIWLERSANLHRVDNPVRVALQRILGCPEAEIVHAIARNALVELDKPKFELVCRDRSGDREGWSWFAVVKLPEGYLDTLGEEHDDIAEDRENKVLRFVEEQGIRIASEGHGQPGGPYANQAWVQWFPSYAVVEQNGGLDI